jgi:glutamyl/glutaminyl-tRNA synthetase
MAGCSRFAPSVTGEAHPGTLLAALLSWLDARARGDRYLLRLEDVDHTRKRPHFAAQIEDDLRWLGIDWDDREVQSDARGRHEAALDRLEAAGSLYPCRCTRAERMSGGRPAPDGGRAYENRCRGRPLPSGGWRASREPVRLALPDRQVTLLDESGLDLSLRPAVDMGDPILVRRDGVLAYQLVVVVDDDAAGVTRVVRGRDIAPSAATQVLLQDLLGLARPIYRHHFLLLEPRGGKLAKLHGSIAARELRAHLRGPALVGFLAHLAGLVPEPTPVTPAALLPHFRWERVRADDAVVVWTGQELRSA